MLLGLLFIGSAFFLYLVLRGASAGIDRALEDEEQWEYLKNYKARKHRL